MRADYNSTNLSYPPQGLSLGIFKKGKRLEAWDRELGGGYRLVWVFEICALAGKPGPKQRQGDLQVPEGVYHVSDLNPKAIFPCRRGLAALTARTGD